MVLSNLDGSAALRIERASMRPLEGQTHDWPLDLVEAAAIACERAELVVGAPVSLELGGDTPSLEKTRATRIELTPAFSPSPYRLVSLLSHDEGPIAPLAVDALAQALEQGVEDGVVRVYARAYRRLHRASLAQEPEAPRHSLVLATRRTAEAALEASELHAEARALRATTIQRCVELDAVDLARLPRSSLGRALRERRELVAAPQRWLDRARASTGTALDVLRRTLGEIPDDLVEDLVAVRAPDERRRREEALASFGRALLASRGRDELEPGDIPAELLVHAEALRARLVDLRPLSLDVRPLPYGHSLKELAIAADRLARMDDPEDRRAHAHEAVRALARAQGSSPARQGLVRGLLSLFSHLAAAKGEVADAMALASTRLRSAAVEVGTRLHEEGILEQAEDALYLGVDELEEALRGEACAFAARARSRRDEDQRFRRLKPPRRLEPRRAGASTPPRGDDAQGR